MATTNNKYPYGQDSQQDDETTSSGDELVTKKTTPTVGAPAIENKPIAMPAQPDQSQLKYKHYDDVANYLEQQMRENEPETEEQRKKREKKEKWEGIISGIGDMGMALSNLYFTTQYAPNMYDSRQSMTAKAKERFDKAKADHEAQRDKYYSYMLALANIRGKKQEQQRQDEAARQTQANWQATYNYNKEKDEKEAKRKQENFQTRMEYLQDKANNKMTSSKSSSGGGRGSYNKTLSLEDGVHRYGSREDYARAVYRSAQEYGIPLTYESGKDAYGRAVVKNKSLDKLAADVEIAAKKNKATAREGGGNSAGSETTNKTKKKTRI